MSRVCSSCFADFDLRRLIRGANGARGCDFCGRYDSPTEDLEVVCSHIEECLRRFWGFAVDQLPYESAEGGYQGQTWYTSEVLFDEEGLSLPRDDDGALRDAILHELPDETWCEYDWLTLDEDVALRSSWDQFCQNIKHHRRFFFHALGGPDDRDRYSAGGLLSAIARMSQHLELIRELPADTRLWRCRPDISRGKRVSAADFGPPPKQLATQSNRMNPPGIPLMYLASTARTALLETRATTARVGQWRTLRSARLLDLRRPPEVPGTFSGEDRHATLHSRFLWDFRRHIMSPVERDDRVHIEYLPSQVVSEFLRDYEFEGGKLDGIAYGSVVDPRGWNVALFVDLIDLGLEEPEWFGHREPWLSFHKTVRL